MSKRLEDMKTWTYECHDGTVLTFRYLGADQKKQYTEFFWYTVFQNMQSLKTRHLTSRAVKAAYEECLGFVELIGVDPNPKDDNIGHPLLFVSENFLKMEYVADLIGLMQDFLVNESFITIKSSDGVDLPTSPEEVDSASEEAVERLGESLELSDTAPTSPPTSPQVEMSSSGTDGEATPGGSQQIA